MYMCIDFLFSNTLFSPEVGFIEHHSFNDTAHGHALYKLVAAAR